MMKCCKADERLGYVGRIVAMDTKVITDALDNGYIPVVSTVGYDDEGHIYNVNADTASAVIAGALGATSLILMTDTKGVLRDKDDESSLIEKIWVSDIPSFIKTGHHFRGHDPQDRVLPRGDPPRRRKSIYHRRKGGAFHSRRNAVRPRDRHDVRK